MGMDMIRGRFLVLAKNGTLRKWGMGGRVKWKGRRKMGLGRSYEETINKIKTRAAKNSGEMNSSPISRTIKFRLSFPIW